MKILIYDEFHGEQGCMYRNCYDDYNIIDIAPKYISLGGCNYKLDKEELIKSIAEKWVEVSRFDANEVSIKDGIILNCNGRSQVKWVVLPDGDNNRYFQQIVVNSQNNL